MKSRQIELDVLGVIVCLMVYMTHKVIFSRQLVDFLKLRTEV